MCQSKADGGKRCPSSSAGAQKNRRIIAARFPSTAEPLMTDGLAGLIESHVQRSKELMSLLDESQQRAILEYTDQDYTEINQYLLDPKAAKSECDDEQIAKIKQQIETLDEAFLQIPASEEPRVLYRYFTPPVHHNDAEQWVEDRFVPGETVTFPTYLSTSAVPDAVMPVLRHSMPADLADLDESASNTVFQIYTRKGLPVSSLAHMPQEQEELLPRNMEFKVLGIKKGVEFKSTTNLLGTFPTPEQVKTARVVYLLDASEES